MRDADEADIAEVVADRDSASSGYFFSETEFNAYGYAFLQQDQVDEAITMFKINTELYPESWNVYDSLGEALLRAGNTDDAVVMYEKSLALNPESPTGKEALESIQDGAEDHVMEPMVVDAVRVRVEPGTTTRGRDARTKAIWDR